MLDDIRQIAGMEVRHVLEEILYGTSIEQVLDRADRLGETLGGLGHQASSLVGGRGVSRLNYGPSRRAEPL